MRIFIKMARPGSKTRSDSEQVRLKQLKKTEKKLASQKEKVKQNATDTKPKMDVKNRIFYKVFDLIKSDQSSGMSKAVKPKEELVSCFAE